MTAIIDRMRKHFATLGIVKDGDLLGVAGCVGKDVTVDTNGGNRDIVVTANTDDVDLDEEIVLPGGADKTYIERNKSIFVDHSYDLASRVGTYRRSDPVKVGGEIVAWRTRVRMLDTPLADDILKIARDHGIGVSIGFSPTNFGAPTEAEVERYGAKGAFKSIVRNWNWLELSFTAFPCNVACQSLAVVSSDAKAIHLEEMVRKGRIRPESAYALGMPKEKASPVRVFVVDGLVATLPGR